MSKRDEFDDPEGFFGRLITVTSGGRGSVFENKSLILSIAVFVLVVALSGVIWASYPSQNPLVGDGAVPVIRADAEPYKQVPDDRGGMKIAHRDSTIFAAMRGDPADSKIENLLDDPAAEKPVDRAQLFAGLKTDLATAAAVTAGDDNKAPVQMARMGDYAQDRPLTEAERRSQAAERNKEMLSEPAAPLPGTENAGAAKPEPVAAPDDEPTEETHVVTETGKGLQEKPKDMAEKQPKPDKNAAKLSTAKTDPKLAKGVKQSPEKTVTVAMGVGKSYVQVASVPSENLVKSEFNTVSSKLPMLSGLSYRVQKADVAGKGTFYRIQVGPMLFDDATKLCAAIKTKKPGGCLVIK